MGLYAQLADITVTMYNLAGMVYVTLNIFKIILLLACIKM